MNERAAQSAEENLYIYFRKCKFLAFSPDMGGGRVGKGYDDGDGVFAYNSQTYPNIYAHTHTRAYKLIGYTANTFSASVQGESLIAEFPHAA